MIEKREKIELLDFTNRKSNIFPTSFEEKKLESEPNQLIKDNEINSLDKLRIKNFELRYFSLVKLRFFGHLDFCIARLKDYEDLNLLNLSFVIKSRKGVIAYVKNLKISWMEEKATQKAIKKSLTPLDIILEINKEIGWNFNSPILIKRINSNYNIGIPLDSEPNIEVFTTDLVEIEEIGIDEQLGLISKELIGINIKIGKKIILVILKGFQPFLKQLENFSKNLNYYCANNVNAEDIPNILKLRSDKDNLDKIWKNDYTPKELLDEICEEDAKVLYFPVIEADLENMANLGFEYRVEHLIQAPIKRLASPGQILNKNMAKIMNNSKISMEICEEIARSNIIMLECGICASQLDLLKEFYLNIPIIHENDMEMTDECNFESFRFIPRFVLFKNLQGQYQSYKVRSDGSLVPLQVGCNENFPAEGKFVVGFYERIRERARSRINSNV